VILLYLQNKSPNPTSSSSSGSGSLTFSATLGAFLAGSGALVTGA